MLLNGIVRNEAANLPRMLMSVAPVITGIAILDTGSTDCTKDMIRAFAYERKIPYVIGDGTFKNFEQARNEALDLAKGCLFGGDYMLLVDADMELILEAPAAFVGLNAPAYQLVQKAGAFQYWNARVLRRDAGARYIGVTHEYLDIPTTRLHGAWFRDHESGANRGDKTERDIRLLRADIERGRENPRSWFYLAQSYNDIGDKPRAETAYLRRASMGAWEEEAWFAQYQAGRIQMGRGDPTGLLKAYQRRPTRAEPLYALARYHRDHGENALACMYAEAGKRIPPTNDELFVDTFACGAGLEEELSIAGFYVPQYQDEARQICYELAIRRDVPDFVRMTARTNQFHYLEKLIEIAPSYKENRIRIPEEPGWTSMNPSVTNWGEDVWVNVRQVNYRIDDHGNYCSWDGEKFVAGDWEYWQKNPIRTRNFLVWVKNDQADPASVSELRVDLPDTPAYALVRGLEDVRIFPHGDDLWGHTNIRELNADGWSTQYMFRIDPYDMSVQDLREIRLEGPRQHEKNWMAAPGVGRFVYRPGVVIAFNGRPVTASPTLYDIGHFSGSSQLIRWDDGWLGVIHEAFPKPGDHRRYYQHRLVYFDKNLQPVNISDPFVFQDRQIEFAAGIAKTPYGVAISFGVRDEEAWIGTISHADVDRVLGRCE